MVTINHEDKFKLIGLKSETYLEDRKSILDSGDDSTTFVQIELVRLSGNLTTLADCSIVGRASEDDFSNGCIVKIAAIYKNDVLPAALKLGLREVFEFLNKNKIKADYIYVNEPDARFTAYSFLSFIYFILDVMKECKYNSTLWVESIAKNEIEVIKLEMNAKDGKDKNKKDKDKKKKKKKKKGKK